MEKDIYQELQQVRYELSKMKLKKTGHNAFSGFDYFELSDFLPQATELFLKHNLTPIFRIEIDNMAVEYAYLTIVRGNEQIIFKKPTAEPRKTEKSNPIQDLGSKSTYLRRYLYLECLDIVENDAVDATIGKEPNVKGEELCTPGQIATIKANGKLIANELKELEIKTTNDIQSLTKAKASELVKLIKERQENANQG